MATTSLGRLTLDLVARIGEFIEPMAQADRAATEATDSITEGFDTASLAVTAFGAIVAGVSVGAVTDYINGLMEAGDQLVTFSKLANSGVEQFQYYAKGAQSAGIEMEQFADQMKDMQDRIGDFQQSGGGPLADFFENIAPLVGVTIQQFQKLSGPEALQLFYDSLEKVGATENDIKFYMEGLIGDSAKLIPLLENGGEGFKKWGDNALAAGSIVSASTANALADANESVNLIMESWTGFKVQMAEVVAPAITLVVDNLDIIKTVAIALGAAIATKLIVQLGILTVQFAIGVAEGIRYQMALAAMAGQTITLTTATIGLRTAFMSLIGGPAGLAMLAVQGVAAGAAFLYMKSSSDEAETSIDKQGKSVADLVGEYNNLSEAQKRAFMYQEAKELAVLSDEYLKATQQVRAYASGIAEVVAQDDASKNAVRGWIKELDNGSISAEELANKINGLNAVNAESKSHMDKHAVASTAAKSAMQNQQNVVDSLKTRNTELAQSHNQVTNSVNTQAQAYLSLTQKQREALKGIESDLSRERYIQKNVAAGWSKDKAEYYADYRNAAGLGYKGAVLSKSERDVIDQGFNLQVQSKNREESEKQIEESQKKQADLQKKQVEDAAKKYSYSKQELAMLQKISEISAKNDLNGIGAKYGIPENLLAAVMTQESKGNINAKSQTGAIGPFQTTGIYRKQYNLSVADSYDVKKSATAAAKDLAKSYQELGSWADAVTAYNAGVKGTKDLNKTGFTISAEKSKEAKNYAPSVDKWYAALNGSGLKANGLLAEDPSKALQQYQEFLIDAEQIRAEILNRQNVLVQNYASKEQQIHIANTEALKQIDEAYTVDNANRAKYIELQKIVYQKDLEEFRRVQVEKIAAYRLGINQQYGQLQQDVIDAQAKMGLGVNYGQWALQNQYGSDSYGLNQVYSENVKNISEDTDITDESNRYALLLEADETYQQSKLALAQKYTLLERELVESQHSAQMGIWQDLLGQTSTIFNSMAEMVKNTAGESSAAYKAMFLVNQGISIAQALINTEVAATKAMAEGGYVAGIPMASVIRGLGYASVGLIGAQTIAGMAHDGIDNIPKEGTWLLDKGERVVDSRTNSDLKNYLANSQSSGANIVINNNGSSRVTAQEGSDGKTYVTIDDVENYLNQSVANPNSKFSKGMKQNFNAPRRR